MPPAEGMTDHHLDSHHPTHAASNPSSTAVERTSADTVAYAFYAVAALAALVGQVWAGVKHIPWPTDGFPLALRIALVAPAVSVIELGGVATAALADVRRRKGETAYAYRAMSLAAALVALAFNVLGHWHPGERFLAFGFGGLSAFAYALWIIHSGARRRDALRATGQMARTAPVYGVVQWLREPAVTYRARAAAMEHGYDLYESLRVARETRRTEARDEAIGQVVVEAIKAEHNNELHAKIAIATYELPAIAAGIRSSVDNPKMVRHITRLLEPPSVDPDPEAEVADAGDHPSADDSATATDPTTALAAEPMSAEELQAFADLIADAIVARTAALGTATKPDSAAVTDQPPPPAAGDLPDGLQPGGRDGQSSDSLDASDHEPPIPPTRAPDGDRSAPGPSAAPDGQAEPPAGSGPRWPEPDPAGVKVADIGHDPATEPEPSASSTTTMAGQTAPPAPRRDEPLTAPAANGQQAQRQPASQPGRSAGHWEQARPVMDAWADSEGEHAVTAPRLTAELGLNERTARRHVNRWKDARAEQRRRDTQDNVFPLSGQR